nr:3-deoxy-7-phosphoheptulonate synthase [Acetobacter persici]
MTQSWQPGSWRERPVTHIPQFDDACELERTELKLTELSPLVSPEECDELSERLAEVAHGDSIVLQAGPCAEALDNFDEDELARTIEALGLARLCLQYLLRKPVIVMGRLAGQFAKPRSNSTEDTPFGRIFTYRGDIINGITATEQARKPDPRRMLRAYSYSNEVLNKLQTDGASLYNAPMTALDLLAKLSISGPSESSLAPYLEVGRAIRFAQSIGMVYPDPSLQTLYIAHEALLLNYEEGLTRRDPRTGNWYAGSGHFLWVGERTRQADGGHVEYLKGIANPIGVKCGPSMTPDDLMELLDILNPNNVPGRVTAIVRAGAQSIGSLLPRLITRVKAEGRHIVWMSDPMHGNTVSHTTGMKTRYFDQIADEATQFFKMHSALGSHAGGLHLEMTGADVTECIGGGFSPFQEDITRNYRSLCDPRLNFLQFMELVALLGHHTTVATADANGGTQPEAGVQVDA